MIRSAMTAIKETTVKFETLAFFTKRDEIKEVEKKNILELFFNCFKKIEHVKAYLRKS